MLKRLIGLLVALAALAVMVATLLNRQNYSSLLPQQDKEPTPQTIEEPLPKIDSTALAPVCEAPESQPAQ